MCSSDLRGWLLEYRITCVPEYRRSHKNHTSDSLQSNRRRCPFLRLTRSPLRVEKVLIYNDLRAYRLGVRRLFHRLLGDRQLLAFCWLRKIPRPFFPDPIGPKKHQDRSRQEQNAQYGRAPKNPLPSRPKLATEWILIPMGFLVKLD